MIVACIATGSNIPGAGGGGSPAWDDVTGKPAFGTASLQNSGAFEVAGAAATVNTSLSTHAALTAAHGATGAVVGTTNSQTLTNKTISGASNTFTNVPYSALTGTPTLGTAAASNTGDFDAAGLATAAAAASVPKSTVTTAGDLIVATGSAAVTRLAKGTDTHLLTMTAGAVGWAAKVAATLAEVLTLGAWNTLTYGATVATNAALGCNFELTATGNFTLSNPINAVDGQILRWRIIQDGTGSRLLTLGANFNLGTDLTAVTLTTSASKADYLTAVYRSSTGKFDVTGFLRGF